MTEDLAERVMPNNWQPDKGALWGAVLGAGDYAGSSFN